MHIDESSPAVVRVFVRFATPAAAAVATSKLRGRFFAGRQIEAAQYDEGAFAAGLYTR